MNKDLEWSGTIGWDHFVVGGVPIQDTPAEKSGHDPLRNQNRAAEDGAKKRGVPSKVEMEENPIDGGNQSFEKWREESVFPAERVVGEDKNGGEAEENGGEEKRQDNK